MRLKKNNSSKKKIVTQCPLTLTQTCPPPQTLLLTVSLPIKNHPTLTVEITSYGRGNFADKKIESALTDHREEYNSNPEFNHLHIRQYTPHHSKSYTDTIHMWKDKWPNLKK